ncbi:hypothetical protein LEP1GSC056_0891 [Leptospira borgpetersenii str. Brem 328]|uniref:Uncharacterized protein n=1 Tax=Leptospira borgpetersenii str. Brem 328 TaxID=1049780 RepID=A0ABC9SE77_LEPBO|nr:hypothetical protein LEP1GSC056_0891 [Leptospira borgpetersenii str. Brem 328]
MELKTKYRITFLSYNLLTGVDSPERFYIKFTLFAVSKSIVEISVKSDFISIFLFRISYILSNP